MVGTLRRIWVSEFATSESFEFARAYVGCEWILRDPDGATAWAAAHEGWATSEITGSDATALIQPTLERAVEALIEALYADAALWRALEARAPAPP
jgi:hypothetical protein